MLLTSTKNSQGPPVLYPLKISSFKNVHSVAGYNRLIYDTLCSQDLTLACLLDVKINTFSYCTQAESLYH